jgi:hypothetical protein
MSKAFRWLPSRTVLPAASPTSLACTPLPATAPRPPPPPPQDDHSAKLYGHVTLPQFKRVLNVKARRRRGLGAGPGAEGTGRSGGGGPRGRATTARPGPQRAPSLRGRGGHACEARGHAHAPPPPPLRRLTPQVGIRVSEAEAALLADKFRHEDLGEVRQWGGGGG